MDEDAGDPMGSQLYGTPSPFEKSAIKNIPKDLPQYLSASGRTPLQELDGIITPNELFYERQIGELVSRMAPCSRTNSSTRVRLSSKRWLGNSIKSDDRTRSNSA